MVVDGVSLIWHHCQHSHLGLKGPVPVFNLHINVQHSQSMVKQSNILSCSKARDLCSKGLKEWLYITDVQNITCCDQSEWNQPCCTLSILRSKAESSMQKNTKAYR